LTDVAAPMVAIGGVTKRYGRTLALDAVSFAVQPNELFALLGPNGAGKTTLLHILCTILKPDSGSVAINGVDVVAHPREARRNLGVVFQEPSLDDRLTVYENLNFHGLVYGVPAARRHSRIDELLALVELAGWRDSLVRTLSSGMKRRLEIARALVHEARVLFLDEPTTGLDAQSRERLWQHVRALRRKRQVTVIVTTHYIEEMEGCDRVCIIDRGHILANDTPAALKSRHGQQIVRVVATDEAASREILAACPAVAGELNGEIVIKSSGDVFAEQLLARFAGRIRKFSVEEPSLESVFLSLTGRELRDQAAAARERTYQFGKRGGEHTR
jgi:ABC-2 type transport system ATP-binding protein